MRTKPHVYISRIRIADSCGYVSLETNRYSAPDILIGKTVEVQKHLELVRVYAGQRLVAEHVRVVGKRDVRVTAPGTMLRCSGQSALSRALKRECLPANRRSSISTWVCSSKSRQAAAF